MIPYFFLLFIVLSSYGAAKYLQYTNRQGSIIFTSLALLLLTVFAAMRATHVGTDSHTYIGFFYSALDRGLELTLLSEPLFSLYNYLSRLLSIMLGTEHQLFFLGISFTVCYLYLNSIEKLSKYKVQSLLLFILLGFYTFHFNGARQAIAIALFLFSYRYIISGEAGKYCILIFIGFLIHKSILVMLPFYYFFRVGLTAKTVCLIVLATVFSALSMQVIVDLAASYDASYSSYADSKFSGSGLVTTLFFSAIFVWLWLSMRINGIKSKLHENSLLAMLVSVCIGWVSVALSLNPSGILRLIVYFTQFSIFALPISVMAFPTGIQRTVVAMVVYGILFAYFYLTTSSFSGLNPYRMSIDLPW